MLKIEYLIHSVVRDRGRPEIQQFIASKAFIYFNLANNQVAYFWKIQNQKIARSND